MYAYGDPCHRRTAGGPRAILGCPKLFRCMYAYGDPCHRRTAGGPRAILGCPKLFRCMYAKHQIISWGAECEVATTSVNLVAAHLTF